MTAKRLKYRGVSTHRFKENPEEKRIAQAWNDQNEHGRLLAHLLDTRGYGAPVEPTVHDHEVAATAIQWLGSPVGQHFLEELGYVRTGATQPSKQSKQQMKKYLKNFAAVCDLSTRLTLRLVELNRRQQ